MPELAPAPAAGQQPQQPPFGASPVSQASPNKGYEAAAAQRLGLIGKQLTEILNLVGYQSDMGKEVLKMLSMVSKMTPADPNPAVERRGIERMAMQNTQNAQQLQQAKQQMAQGAAGAGGPQGQPPGGPPGAPPMAAGMPRAA